MVAGDPGSERKLQQHKSSLPSSPLPSASPLSHPKDSLPDNRFPWMLKARQQALIPHSGCSPIISNKVSPPISLKTSSSLGIQNLYLPLQVATIGYGDITAQTTVEEGVAIFVFVLGIIFFGVLVGSLTQLLQSASKNARRAQVFREKM